MLRAGHRNSHTSSQPKNMWQALSGAGVSSWALKLGHLQRTVKQYKHPAFGIDLSQSKQPEHCVVCHNFNALGHEKTTINENGADLVFFFHVSELRSDCVYCSLIVQIRTRFAPQPRNPPSMEDLVSLHLYDSKPIKIEFRRKMPGDREWKSEMATVAAISVYVSQPTAALPHLGVLGSVSPRSDSDECYRFVETNLKNCLSSHALCASSKEARFPHRVLYVGTEKGDQMKLVDQVKGKGREKASYAALSHCWGEHQPLKTVRSNLNEHMQQVEWSKLPAVFQDAVRVCRRLSIEYLWIDSLCIIQDSTEDWETESAKMSDYYESAVITVCAASSANGSEPFLAERSKRWLPHAFNLVVPALPQCSIMAREVPRGERQEDNEKLMTRGWCWQEAVLSIRTLVYAASGITWVCRSECVAEDGSDGRRVDTHHMAMGVSGKYEAPGAAEMAVQPQGIDESQVFNADDEEKVCKKIIDSWWRLVQSFSGRSLTCNTDRLPGLSGVASRVQKKLNCRYLAGLWEIGFVASLCWFTDTDDLGLCFPSMEYIAPSWSWASVFSVSNWATLSDHFTASVEVVEAQCDVLGLNPLGKVSSGYLLLKGKARLVPIFCTNTLEKHMYEIGWRELKLHKLSWLVYRMCNDGELLRIDCPLTISNHRVCRAQRSHRRKRISGLVCAMLLGQSRDAGESSEPTFHILLLGLPQDGNSLTRVGLLQMSDDRLFTDAKEEVVRII